MDAQRAAATRLVRRTGFGATGSEIDAAAAAGPARFVARLVAADPQADAGTRRTPPPAFDLPDPSGMQSGKQSGAGADTAAKKQQRMVLRNQGKQLVGWWLRRMVAVDQPFGEKATFVWHAHFATSLQKVKISALMLAQNETQRRLATGDFGTLAYAMLTDAATVRWLDGGRNTVKGPNENLSREFMEIFTLGHADGYTETDVREGARALTGWQIDKQNGSTVLRPAQHDNGSKTFLGVTGNLDAHGYCAAILARPGCAPYVVGRLWQHFVSDTPPTAAVLGRLVAAYGAGHDLAALFTAMFTDPSFAAAQGSLVIGPVEWLVGALRALHLPLDTPAAALAAASALESLGQLPLFPPSVGGWPSGRVWLSTAAADLRFDAAAQLTAQADLSAVHGTTTARLEAVEHLLGVPGWSAATLAVLKGYAGRPADLVAVALNTPDYLVH